MDVGARGSGHLDVFAAAAGNPPGRRRVGKSGPSGKSFEIPTQLVWEACAGGILTSCANKGAARVDGVRRRVEADLQNDLYRIWNRMSWGTNFRRR